MSQSEDDSQKTEEPTPRKLSEARKKGQIANSREVTSFAVLLAATVAIGVLSPFTASRVAEALRFYVTKPDQIGISAQNLGDLFVDTLLSVGLAVSPVVAVVMVLALFATLGQTGLLWTAEPLNPQLQRISPIAGAKRLFSLKSVVELLKGMVKIALVAAVAWIIMLPVLDQVENYVQMDPITSFDELYFLVIKLFIGVVAILAVLALADFLYQRYEFMKQMRMSLQEVRDEHKQAEGDPMVKSRLRQIRMERARARMMAAVPQADVVVTNPTHYSVALKYDPDTMGAPVVIAKGVDDVAFRIREVANENDIPIVPNPPLARALHDNVEIDQEVPSEHYRAVAEVISFVFKLKNKAVVAE